MHTQTHTIYNTRETTSSLFQELVEKHDLTYDYSDDHRAWRRGHESHQEILRLAKALPREEACRIWNAMVDKRIREGHRHLFYWN